MKYRKKPVVIEAFQMTEARRWDNRDWPEWLNRAWNKPDFSEGAVTIDADDPKCEKLVIGTLEGVLRINWNDWIIKGVKGELYACKPDIFEATYEPYEQERNLGNGASPIRNLPEDDRKEYTQCFHECPVCHKIVRQQTFPNQAYIQLKDFHCLTCDTPMKRNLIIVKGDLPLKEAYQWKTVS